MAGGNQRGGGRETNGPLTGDGYVEFSDQLRDVEEMLNVDELRNQTSEIRDIARGVRQEFKRHGVEPQWDLVSTKIYGPLLQLRDQVNEELARLRSKDNRTPIDRDPVPAEFSEQVRLYYERLSSTSGEKAN